MFCLYRGVFQDCFFFESKFEGKTYDSYQLEVFDPNFRSPKDRHRVFKLRVEDAEKLGLTKPEKVKEYKGKNVEIVGDSVMYGNREQFLPSSVKII